MDSYHPVALGYSSQLKEIESEPLNIVGAIPPWLEGSLIRNGPGSFEIGTEQYNSFFDGLAKLHSFRFYNSQVLYSCRFLDTKSYRQGRKQGRIAYREFGTDPSANMLGRVVQLIAGGGQNTNVTVTRFGGQFVAMSEAPVMTVFDPNSLKTLGLARFTPAPQCHFYVPHTHHDLGASQSVLVGVQLTAMGGFYHIFLSEDMSLEQPSLSIHRRLLCSLPVERPAWMHSFAVTSTYIIIPECPWLHSKHDTVTQYLFHSGLASDQFQWLPERKSRFLVVNRHTGELRGVYSCPSFFTAHIVNAFEMGSLVSVDCVAFPGPWSMHDFSLQRLRHGDRPDHEDRGQITRFTIELDSAAELRLSGACVRSEVMVDRPLEYPTINHCWAGKAAYRFVYGVSSDEDGLDCIVKADLESRTCVLEWKEEGCYVGEAVMVPFPKGNEEDSGVLLVVVLEPAKSTSSLVVFNAADFRVLARCELPHHVPFSNHGMFFSDGLGSRFHRHE